MGLDGGTYITRSDVLRGQSWDMATADTSRSTRGGTVSSTATFKRKSLDKKLERSTRWSTCSLTGDRLKAPIVADYLGSLYNRGNLREDPDDAMFVHYWYANHLAHGGEAFAHLRSKRDVFPVQMSPLREGEGEPEASGFVCPITQAACGTVPFSALPGCGHVFSSKALREVQDNTCMVCGKEFRNPDDLVTLNGSPEEVSLLREKLRLGAGTALQGKRHSKKRRRMTVEIPQSLEQESRRSPNVLSLEGPSQAVSKS